MDKFRGKYRRGTVRMRNWNYGWKGDYFITLRIRPREFFGKIENSTMMPSDIGRIVHEEWVKTPWLRPDMNLSLGAFVVMPDHFHGIIHIGRNRYNAHQPAKSPANPPSTTNPSPSPADPPQGKAKTPQNRFGPQSKNMASIIRGFKSAVTIRARRMEPEFEWQSRYFCHIIFEKRRYHRIERYIINNPKNWRNAK